MRKCEVSQLPQREGDGYSYGGEYVVSLPFLDRRGAGPLDVMSEKLALIIGPGQAACLTANFICEAINARLEQRGLVDAE